MSSGAEPAAFVALSTPSRHASAWTRALSHHARVSALDVLGIGAGSRALVLTAHPDDETLGLGATLACLGRAGVSVHLVCATAGEAAYDVTFAEAGLGDPPMSSQSLAALRRTELSAAAADLGIDTVEVLGLPDGAVAEHEDELTEQIRRRLEDGPRVDAVLALWEHDPHPDHATVGRASVSAAGGRSVHGFPLWAFHHTDPATLSDLLTDAELVDLDATALALRGRATTRYFSQTMSPQPGVGPVVPDTVVSWSHELLVAM